MTKFIIIRTDGTITEKEYAGSYNGPGGEGNFTLEDMQEAVGGLIEIVPLWDSYNDQPARIFCNEEGKLKRLPFNSTATALWLEHLEKNNLPAFDMLLGDVLVITGTDEELEAL